MRTGERRTPVQREHDRALVAKLALLGLSQSEIAARLGALTGRPVSRQTVAHDLRAVRAEWRAERLRAAGERVAEELARLALVERNAWASWDRSTGERVERETAWEEEPSGDGAGPHPPGSPRRTVERVWQGVGDPRALAIVLACADRRAALLGLLPPLGAGRRAGASGGKCASPPGRGAGTGERPGEDHAPPRGGTIPQGDGQPVPKGSAGQTPDTAPERTVGVRGRPRPDSRLPRTPGSPARRPGPGGNGA